MINYHYYIEVKHENSIISPISKVIIMPDDMPNIEYTPEEEKEKKYAIYAYNIFSRYRENKEWYHYTLRLKFDNDCIHYLIAEHWTNSELKTFWYTNYQSYKAFSNVLGFDPEQKEKEQTDKSEQARRTREEYLRTLKNPGPFAKECCYY